MSKSVYTVKYKDFLDRLIRARKEAGMTQVEVAEALGKHQSYVAKCENGERRIDIVELTQFARLYGKPLNYFVDA
jgi:transcriptional regulator with XRE-family HTH domain